MSQEKINQIKDMPGVTGVSVTDSKGQITTTTLDSPQADLGSISGAMYSNIGVQIKRMQRGTVKRLVLETDMGITLISGLADGGLLIVFATTLEGFNLAKLMTAATQF